MHPHRLIQVQLFSAANIVAQRAAFEKKAHAGVGLNSCVTLVLTVYRIYNKRAKQRAAEPDIPFPHKE